jgi:hypothetical protein
MEWARIKCERKRREKGGADIKKTTKRKKTKIEVQEHKEEER